MGVHYDAEGSARQIWGAEGGADAAPADSHGEGEVTRASRPPEHLGFRTDRADCTGGIPRGGVTGGILSQLISQAEDQLREAEECISWYERAKQKAHKQLENLKQLQQLAEQEAQDD